LESRVPFLDKPIVEFGASLPLNVKFAGGETKRPLRSAFENVLPEALTKRRDKMGFPVPLKEWFGGGARDFVVDLFSSQAAGSRPWINQKAILAGLEADTGAYSRKLWGLVSLELWQRAFHDNASETAKRARSFDTIDA
jgi:asparagine synthase (glutamine-hydrolysing)